MQKAVVAPRAGAWIEIFHGPLSRGTYRASLPVRERGLKFFYFFKLCLCTPSLPVRERGLKSTSDLVRCMTETVAPRAGAWIEIRETLERKKMDTSLPVRERGLK